jgi:hypothetical protein
MAEIRQSGVNNTTRAGDPSPVVLAYQVCNMIGAGFAANSPGATTKAALLKFLRLFTHA